MLLVLWTLWRLTLLLWPSLMSSGQTHSYHILTFSPRAHRSLEAFQLRHKFLSSRVTSKQVRRQCAGVLRRPGTFFFLRQAKDNIKMTGDVFSPFRCHLDVVLLGKHAETHLNIRSLP